MGNKQMGRIKEEGRRKKDDLRTEGAKDVEG
jgi:hypothetical protein